MKYKASLRIFSEQLNIEKISELIGLKYDEKTEIGQPRGKGLKIQFKENIWIVNSNVNVGDTLDVHIEALLKKVAPVKSKIKKLSSKCDVVCQCIVEGDENPILNFPKSILEGLNEISAELDIDIYIV